MDRTWGNATKIGGPAKAAAPKRPSHGSAERQAACPGSPWGFGKGSFSGVAAAATVVLNVTAFEKDIVALRVASKARLPFPRPACSRHSNAPRLGDMTFCKRQGSLQASPPRLQEEQRRGDFQACIRHLPGFHHKQPKCQLWGVPIPT